MQAHYENLTNLLDISPVGYGEMPWNMLIKCAGIPKAMPERKYETEAGKPTNLTQSPIRRYFVEHKPTHNNANDKRYRGVSESLHSHSWFTKAQTKNYAHYGLLQRRDNRVGHPTNAIMINSAVLIQEVVQQVNNGVCCAFLSKILVTTAHQRYLYRTLNTSI